MRLGSRVNGTICIADLTIGGIGYVPKAIQSTKYNAHRNCTYSSCNLGIREPPRILMVTESLR